MEGGSFKLGESIKKYKTLKVDILTPIRFGGPQKWGNELVSALKKEGIEAHNIHDFTGIIKRFFYTEADIIHTTLPLFFNLQNKKIILTIKGDYRKEKNFWKLLWPLAIKRAKVITVPSKFLKEELKIDRAIVIPNSIFPENYRPVKHKDKKILRITTITSFAFWNKARGIIELMKILEKLKKESKQKFKFTVIGDGKFLKKIKEKSKKFEIPVEFTSFHPSPKKILERSDIFVYYSFHDNFPISILEAMACGLPVVANEFGAVKEIIKKDFCTNDQKKYLKKLIWLTSSKKTRENIGSEQLKKIENKFSWQKQIKILKKYYEI